MNRVFISYSRKNETFAERLARDLGDAGLDVWIDLRQIIGGELWQKEIFRGLQRAEFVILCLSPTALESEWVQREIEIAREQDKRIFPVMVETSFSQIQQHPSLAWLLDIQFIDFVERYEQAFPELLRALPGGRRLGTYDDFDPESIPNPFKGLEAFQQRDAAFFFGREDMTRKALARMRRTNFLSVVGASGSGKSSLVRAGVIPALRENAIPGSSTWPILIFTPGTNPINALAERLHPLLAQDDSNRTVERIGEELRNGPRIVELVEEALSSSDAQARLLIVIDQFEETFTRATEPDRQAFLELLRMVTMVSSSRAQIIATMRADFFDQLSRYPAIAELFEQEHLLIVTEMTTANLLRAIEGPAEAVGLRYEAGLVDRILEDVRSQPGSLPLLQYALRELYKRRNGAILSMAAYEEIGGVRQALAQHAEAIYSAEAPVRQQLMERILLRLVEIGPGGDAMRRRVPRSEMRFKGVSPQAIQDVIDTLTAPEARLLIASRDIRASGEPEIWLEVSHEALIREWERFKIWVNESTEDLRYDQELREAAAGWQAGNQDAAYLLRGNRLARAEVWLEKAEASDLQRAFIEASTAERSAREAAEQARMQRELELQAQSTRRARFALLVTGGLLALALVSIIIFNQTNRELENSQRNLISVNEALAEQIEIARTRSLETRSLAVAGSAEQALSDRDGDLAIALALIANESEAAPPQTQRTLNTVGLAPGTRLRLSSPSTASALAFSPDDRLIAMGGNDGVVTLLQTEDGSQIRQLRSHQRAISEAVFHPDGELLLTIADGVRIWRVETGDLIQTLIPGTTMLSAGVLPDGRWVTASALGEILAWDANGALPPQTIWQAETSQVLSAFDISSNGQIAASLRGGTVLLIDSATGDVLWQTRPLGAANTSASKLDFNAGTTRILAGFENGALIILNAEDGSLRQTFAPLDTAVVTLGYLPGGESFMASGNENTLRIFDITTTRQIRALDMDARINRIALNSTGRVSAVGLLNNTLRLIDVQGSAEVLRYGGSSDIYGVALNPLGDQIVAGSSGGNLIVWNVGTAERISLLNVGSINPLISAVAYSPDGTQIAAGGTDGSLTILNGESGEIAMIIAGHPGALVLALSYSPDGRYILSAASDRRIIVWDAESGAAVRSLSGHSDSITSITISGDSRLLLSGARDGSLLLWDIESGEALQQLIGHTQTIRSVALNADGSLALSASVDSSIRLWDLNSGRERRRFVGHDAAVQGISFMPGESQIVSASADGTIRFWQVSNGAEVGRFDLVNDFGRPLAVRLLLLDADGQRLLTAQSNNTLRLWRSYPNRDILMEWVRENRYVRPLNCNERLAYNLEAEGSGEQVFVGVEPGNFLNLRSEPDPNSSLIASLSAGAPLRLLGASLAAAEAEWTFVCTADGLEGWANINELVIAAEAS